MWFNSTPADLSYSLTAENVIKIQIITNVSAKRLYEILITGENQTIWAKGYKKTVWHNKSPYEMGSIRDIYLDWINVRERILALESAKRFAFSSDALTVPIVTKMIEDIRFSETDSHKTLLEWNVYYDLIWYLKPFKKILNTTILYKMFDDFANGLVTYAESN